MFGLFSREPTLGTASYVKYISLNNISSPLTRIVAPSMSHILPVRRTSVTSIIVFFINILKYVGTDAFPVADVISQSTIIPNGEQGLPYLKTLLLSKFSDTNESISFPLVLTIT